MGFADAARAEKLVTAELGLDLDPGDRPGPAALTAAPAARTGQGRDETLLAAIAGAADPDLALTGLAPPGGARAARDRGRPRPGPAPDRPGPAGRRRAGRGPGRPAGHAALRARVPAAADRGARLQRGPGRPPGPP